MELVVKRFNKMMFVSLFVVILDLLVGGIYLAFTDLASKINIILLGSLILIHGLFYLIRYIYDGLGNRVFSIDLIAGVAGVILGIFTIFNPYSAINVIGILAGIWLIIRGLEKLYYSVIFIKNKEDLSPLFTMISILVIVMGVLVMINPFDTFMLVTRLCGVFLICDGLLEIMACSLFSKKNKDILKLFE